VVLTPLTPFERALVAHLVADWLLQNSWMAVNKTNLRHPAGWVHAGIHGVGLALALGPLAGVVLGFVHLIIDTRLPLNWWIRQFKKSETAPQAELIAIGTDQALHIATIAAWIAFA
jgi:Na+-driven multidrug efflux pump